MTLVTFDFFYELPLALTEGSKNEKENVRNV